MIALVAEMLGFLVAAALVGLLLGYLVWGWGQANRVAAARAEGAMRARTSVDGEAGLRGKLDALEVERGRLEAEVDRLSERLAQLGETPPLEDPLPQRSTDLAAGAVGGRRRALATEAVVPAAGLDSIGASGPAPDWGVAGDPDLAAAPPASRRRAAEAGADDRGLDVVQAVSAPVEPDRVDATVLRDGAGLDTSDGAPGEHQVPAAAASSPSEVEPDGSAGRAAGGETAGALGTQGAPDLSLRRQIMAGAATPARPLRARPRSTALRRGRGPDGFAGAAEGSNASRSSGPEQRAAAGAGEPAAAGGVVPAGDAGSPLGTEMPHPPAFTVEGQSASDAGEPPVVDQQVQPPPGRAGLTEDGAGMPRPSGFNLRRQRRRGGAAAPGRDGEVPSGESSAGREERRRPASSLQRTVAAGEPPVIDQQVPAETYGTAQAEPHEMPQPAAATRASQVDPAPDEAPVIDEQAAPLPASATPQTAAALPDQPQPQPQPQPVGHGAGEGKDGDDLRRIRGIGKVMERLLHAQGIHHYRQIAALTAADVERLTRDLAARAGRIAQQRWVEQAEALHREGTRGSAGGPPA